MCSASARRVTAQTFRVVDGVMAGLLVVVAALRLSRARVSVCRETRVSASGSAVDVS